MEARYPQTACLLCASYNIENWDHLWLTVAYLKLSLSLSYMQLPTAY